MTVANLRTAAGQDPHNKSLHDLVGELSTRGDEFRRRWGSHNVRIPRHRHQASLHGQTDCDQQDGRLGRTPRLRPSTPSAAARHHPPRRPPANFSGVRWCGPPGPDCHLHLSDPSENPQRREGCDHERHGNRTRPRTNYGPRRPNSAHLDGQPWTPAISGSGSTSVDVRSGGQGVASSNLASPTRRCRIVTPDQSRVHPATGPSSTSLSAEELGPDWAHQREYATPTSMASHTLEKVQLDAGVGHPGQRRVSQPVPYEARQPKIINQLVPSRRIAQGRGRDHRSTRINQQCPGSTT